MSSLLNKHWLFALKRSLSVEFGARNAAKILSSNCYLHSGKCVNSSIVEVKPSKVDKFAYGSDSLAKRDKSAPGLFSLKTIHLPAQLDENLKKYLERYPRKMLENDGSKLAKHLRNRGRPTETTWKKYKESKAREKKALDLKVNIDDVVRLKEDQENHEGVIVDYLLDEDKNDKIQESSASESQLTMKRPKLEEYKVVRYKSRESAAFAASRIPASYGATLRVLHEISRREPNYKPETLLDFGSGTGTAVWAAHSQWSNSIKEYQCIDVSESMNEIAEYLLRGSESFKKPLHIPYVYFKRFLPISNKVTYDIVISSYSLSEIPRIATRKEAIRNLWAKTNDFLVLIEYGNNEGFEILLEARNMVEKDKHTEMTVEEGNEVDQEDPFTDFGVIDQGYVFAPCPHDSTCARAEVDTRDHPCNFEQQVQLAFAEKRTSLKKWGFVTERFSYLVLRKGARNEEDKPWPRILEPVKLRGRHVICKLCSSNGDIAQKVLTKKKDSDIYKCARHLSKWGDLMPIPEDRKRPLTNPHIAVTRRGKLRN